MGRAAGRDPAVIRAMRGFKLALERREREQMRDMAGQWLRLERHLEDRIEAVAERIARIRDDEGGVPEWRIFQLDRYQSLLSQLQAELVQYGEYAERQISGGQETLARWAINHAREAVVTLAPSVRASFSVLPIEAVQNMVGLAGNGAPLGNLLRQAWPESVSGLTEALVRGTAVGWNPRKTAREMRRGMAHGLNRALNIARTEQLRVYRETSRQQYIHSGVVKGYRRLASRSDRTCAACLMADGQIYGLDEPFREHPSGRCTLVPLVTGMQPVDWQMGRDWFRNQDPDTQRKILGPGRYDAWQDGKFDLDQLVTTTEHPEWGGSLTPTPLRDLI